MTIDTKRPTEPAKKVRTLVDAYAVATFHVNSYGSIESQARQMERRCQEFNEFIRDHRSQDDVRLEVRREYQSVCSVCGEEWEPYTIEPDNLGPDEPRSLVGKQACIGCGAVVEGSA